MDEEIATVTVVATTATDDDVEPRGTYSNFVGNNDDDDEANRSDASMMSGNDNFSGSNSQGGGAGLVKMELGCLYAIVLASVVEFWQAAELCEDADGQFTRDNCTGRNGYAVAAGVVSAALTGIYVILRRCNLVLPVTPASAVFAGFIFLWWFFATCVGTFKGPFLVASNGYLADWICLFASAVLLYVHSPRVRAAIDGTMAEKSKSSTPTTMLYVVFVASLVVLIAASIVCDDAGKCEKENAFAVACSVVSLVLSICVILAKVQKLQYGPIVDGCIYFFLAVWWFLGVSITTFETPFLVVGNGFLGVWTAFICSLIACAETINHVPVLGKIIVSRTQSDQMA